VRAYARTCFKTAAEMDAQLRGEHSGYDPLPALKATNQPVLWLNGSIDRQVPTALNTETLSQLGKPQFDVHVLPGVDHWPARESHRPEPGRREGDQLWRRAVRHHRGLAGQARV